MELIKENRDKKRSVYKLPNGNFKKYWHDRDIGWVESHAHVLNQIVPNYLVEYGEDSAGGWIEVCQLKGFPANLRAHTDEFMLFVYEGCLKNIKETAPYAHGDWVLSNIYIEGDRLNFCDWDNIGIHSTETILDKLHKDLHSAFGDRFYELISYDPSGF